MKIVECEFPDDILNDPDQSVWVRIDDRGLAVAGINSTLSWLSGMIFSARISPVGTEVVRGKNLASIEGPMHFDVVKSPLTGEVVEVNQKVIEDPRLLNRDPYGEGWLVKVRPSKLEEERALLKDTSSAKPQLEAKIVELRVHCFAAFPDREMYEIGTECSAVLVKLEELLAASQVGTVVHVVSDDPLAQVEMVRWSEDTGNTLLEVRNEGKIYHFLVKKGN